MGPVSEAEAGAGCYTAAGVVYASILGTVKRVPDTAGGTGARVEVARGSRAAALVPTLSSIVLAKVLSINSKQAKVPPPAPLAWWTSPPALNAGPQLVASPRGSPAKLRRQVHILTVDGAPCLQPFPAVIRSVHSAQALRRARGARCAAADALTVRADPHRTQDVRATNLDTVKIAESFRPGDLVRAAVISLGDQRSYFLSTARADLGVVHAQLGGEQMGALDQDTLMCPTTRVTKRRKVAMAPS